MAAPDRLEVHFRAWPKLIVGVDGICANTPTDVLCKIRGGGVSDKVDHDLDFVCLCTFASVFV